MYSTKRIWYLELSSVSVPIALAVLLVLVNVCCAVSLTSPKTKIFYSTKTSLEYSSSDLTYETVRKAETIQKKAAAESMPGTPATTSTSEIPKPTSQSSKEVTMKQTTTIPEIIPKTPASTSTTKLTTSEIPEPTLNPSTGVATTTLKTLNTPASTVATKFTISELPEPTFYPSTGVATTTLKTPKTPASTSTTKLTSEKPELTFYTSSGVATTTLRTPNTPDSTVATKLTTSELPEPTFYPSTGVATTTLKTPKTPASTSTTKLTTSEIPELTFYPSTGVATTTLKTPNTPASTSTSTPYTTTTTVAPILNVVCSMWPYFIYEIVVLKPIAAFQILGISPTSVRLLIYTSGFGDMNIIYFSPEGDELNEKNATEVCQRTEVNAECIIQNLASNQSYVFCLTKNTDQQFSPFNCHSHFLEPYETSDNAWLLRAELPLFVALVVTGSIVCVVIGCVLTFCVLRMRPTMLKDSQRLRRASRKSRTMVLYPKNGFPQNASKSPNRISDSTALYAAIQSPRERRRATLHDSWPPLEQAPDTPVRGSIESSEFSVSTQSTIPVADFVQVDGQDNHDYESLEYYKELF